MKIIHSFVIVILCFSIHSFGQTQQSKKDIKEVVKELNDYRLNKNYEYLITKLNIHTEFQNLEIKNKKLKLDYDSTIECYKSKKQLFKDSDSTVNYYFSLLQSKKYL